LSERRNARAVPHWLERQGYVQVRNEGDKQGYWSILSKRTPIYAKATLSPQERWRAARDLVAIESERRKAA
jgi:hypothetical protein